MDLPQPPGDPELRNIIDKLAQFVARNGPEFEHMTKTKQKNNPKFSFLFGGDHYHYYNYKVNTEQAILRQKGHPPSSSMPPQSGMFNQPPPGMNAPPWRGGSPGFRGPPPNFGGRPPGPRMNVPPPQQMHHDNWNMGGPPPMHHGNNSGRPRPLMDIAPYTSTPPSTPPVANSSASDFVSEDELDKLREEIQSSEKQMSTLREQISQSEQNLAAQRKVTDGQVNEISETTVRKSRYEYLELLSQDVGTSLEEIGAMVQPIIDSCTKETIGSGKVWIFQYATSHDRNRLLAHFLAYKVTEPTASFQLKLHLIYLMNDVLHHCIRKNNDDLKGSLESVAVEMFCSAWLSASETEDSSVKEGKLSKLINLWQEKSIFSPVTLRRMREVDETWKSCQQQLRLDYEQAINSATKHLMTTYQKYSDQHNAFVTHAQSTIKSLESKLAELRQQLNAKASIQASGAPSPGPIVEAPKKGQRGSRWDTGSDGQAMPHLTNEPPPSGVVLPDLSRPPPGFGAGPIPDTPPTRSSMPENSLLPTLPYYDLPAGLMVPLIKLEDSGYKPIDPNELRLPPPSHPTDRLMAALDQFYAPPSHDRPRDPEGWEMLGLYEWSRAKTAAIKRKADDIESGRRERSPVDNEEPFADEDYQENDEEPKPAPRYRSRSRSRSRTRSRTRSRSRESTPDDNRGRSRRSPSPDGEYALPSYLTKRSPSPDQHQRPSPPRRERKTSLRRSPTPPETSFRGFGGGGTGSTPKQLDSSNKGHQMMQKMGWKGSGLGTSEDGIVEPISGGEVRDRQDQFRGVGHGSGGPDPFEAFRKSKAGSFYSRMKERDKERDHHSSRKGGNFKN